MSKLTLDEAIKHCLEVAEQNDAQAEKWREEGGEEWGKTTTCRECAADHRQLAEWLMELKDLRAEQNDQYVFIHELMNELKEAKRLLKLAVEDFSKLDRENAKNKNCMMPEMDCANCPLSWDSVDDRVEPCHSWRYTDEAKKLINDEK
jgi:hypothetical protein